MQGKAQGQIEWQTSRVSGNDPLAVRASKKLKNDGQLVTLFHPTALRLELDKIPLWRGNHVGVKQLIEDFASYLYLQRPRAPEVLVNAIRDGISSTTWQSETFAFAESHDEKLNRYLGLRAGRIVAISADGPGLVVKPDRALSQMVDEEAAKSSPASPEVKVVGVPAGSAKPQPGDVKPPSEPVPVSPKPKHFFGNVQVDAARIGRDVDVLAKEIIQNLAKLPGATVKVTIEIQADTPGGFPDDVVRTVGENCRTLKFTSHAFEKE